MGHIYQTCPNRAHGAQNVRMVMFENDEEGDRRFYGCRSCSELVTKMPRRNAMTQGWPADVRKRAIDAGWLTKDSKVQGP